MTSEDLHKPLQSIHWVKREKLTANDYNPNKVLKDNLELLKRSILTNGWTLPIVVTPEYVVIDGFHRLLVSGEEPLVTLLDGMVPVVIVDHKDQAANVYGTVTHNRARGQHLLEPMKNIVKKLLENDKSVEEIGVQLGMKKEEIFRLSEFSREDFLQMILNSKEYSKAQIITKY